MEIKDAIFRGLIVIQNQSQLEKDIQSYFSKVETILSEFVGYSLEIPVEKITNDGEIIFGFNATNNINSNITIEMANTITNELMLIIEESNNNEDLDMDIFYNLTKKLVLALTFSKDEPTNITEDHDKLKFIRDFIKISSQTYESIPADIGMILCGEKKLNTLKDQLNFDLIYLTEKKDLITLFGKEKPLLRLVNGKTIILVLNNQFQVYAILRNNGPGNLSDSIKQIFDSYVLDRTIIECRRFILSLLNKHIANSDETTRTVLEIVKNGIVDTKYVSIHNRPDFIYIEAENKKVDIYTKHDFIITHKNGSWNLRNYYLLQTIIIQYIFANIHPLFSLEEKSKPSVVLDHIFNGMEKFTKLIKELSKSGTGSIIMMVRNQDFNTAISGKTAKELLDKTPIKIDNEDKIYKEIIKKDDIHLNLTDINENLIESICSIDGALIIDSNFNILSFGEVIDVSGADNKDNVYGTGTFASQIASKDGLAIKVSEDGDVKVFFRGNHVLNI